MKNKREDLKTNSKLGEILIHYKIITPQQLKEVLNIQKMTEKRIGEILIEKGWVNQDEINWTLGKQLDLPYVHINLENINKELSLKIPEYTLRKFNFLPLIELDDEITVAMADPTDEEAREAINQIIGKKIKVVLASYKNIRDSIDLLFKEKET